MKNHQRVSKATIEATMEVFAEGLAEEAADHLEVLPNESYLPDDSAKLIDRAREAIIDALRLKPIDWNEGLSGFFRSLAPTNPATLLAKGEAV